MTARNKILLKLLSLTAVILYGWSFLWVSMLYMYGALFSPLSELGWKKSIYFEIFVALLSIIIMAMVILRIKGRTFFSLLLQDIVLVIVSVPFLVVVADVLLPDATAVTYGAVFALTLLIININDWVKTK